MARYRNGRIPARQLIWFWALNQYGRRERFRATRATAARLQAFIADVKRGTGVQLYITSGPNVYRSFAKQVWMRAKYAALGRPLQAAYPGASSHGGEYHGDDSLAADIYNYRDIPWATFVYYAHKHGLITDFVTPTEYWHIGDFNPFSMPAGTSSSTSKPANAEEEEELMPRGFYYKKNGVYYVGIVTGGLVLHYQSNDSQLNNDIAETWKTGNFVEVTESVYNAWIEQGSK